MFPPLGTLIVAGKFNRQSRISAAVTSMKLSSPNPTSATLRAKKPEVTAIMPSITFQATVEPE
jgi:hypothetical protein